MTGRDVLSKIKRLMLAGDYRFTEKARIERERDALPEQSVVESIVNARGIDKTLRSDRPFPPARKEKPYVIKSPDFDGLWIYTKGKIVRESGRDVYYVLVSCKLVE